MASSWNVPLRIWQIYFALLCFAHAGFATYTTARPSAASRDSFNNTTIGSHLLKRAAIGNNVAIRLLPIGDSITDGAASSNSNGYRLELRNLLLNSGSSNVDFIGNKISGDSNPDNQHEGYGGYTINQILAAIRSNSIVYQQPNVVLIHAGTNDVWRPNPNADEPYAGAPDRLSRLIEFVLCNDPDAIVLVGLIVGNGYAQQRIDDYNARIPNVVASWYAKGFKVRTADFTSIRDSLLADGVHPNDQGYRRMAEIWFAALQRIPGSWFGPPGTPKAGSTASRYFETCSRDSLGWLPAAGGQSLALGAHVPGDDGSGGYSGAKSSWAPLWEGKGIVNGGPGPCKDAAYVQLADLDGDGRADYLWSDPVSGATSAYLNKGLGVLSWTPINGGNAMNFGAGPAIGLHWADMNADGKADYIMVTNDGNINVFMNTGPYGDFWGFAPPVTISNIPGANQIVLLFGDLNGDNRTDILRMNGQTGWIDAFIQDGSPLGTPGFKWKVCNSMGSIINNPFIILTDINGDGRDDFLSVDADSGVKGFLNIPDPSSCWGGTWQTIGEGEKGVALGVGVSYRDVRFADMDGDGKADYIAVDPKNGALSLWLNTAKSSPGDTALGPLKGLGGAVRLADLDGDGKDDYISVGPKGEAIGYLNGGQYGDTGWLWNPVNNAQLIALGIPGGTRTKIHFADINGDGRDDYLVVDEATGAVQCFYNGGSAGGGWFWFDKGSIAAGVGPGQGVRFADMDGDGRDDYIYVNDIGAVAIYLNKGNGDNFIGWFPVAGGKNVASGVGGRGQDIQFADIDGDGRADYLWVHPENGAVDVWYNGGPFGDGWLWQPGGGIAAGVGSPGRNTAFARLSPRGRADYVLIGETDGSLKAWYNWCGKVIGTVGAGGASQPNNGPQPQCPAGPLPTPSGPDSGGDTPSQPITSQIGIGAPSITTTTVTTDGKTFTFTIPTGITKITTITIPNGPPLTFTPPTTTTTTTTSPVLPFGLMIPIATTPPQGRGTDQGTELSCTVWFFSLCLNWEGINIGGWLFSFPPGIRPPGPPPPIRLPSAPGFTWSIRGPLPSWPTMTIGPDRAPTYPPKPSDGPDRGCKTQSAELCMTTTSLSVSSTSTNTRIASTCATIYGCEVTDSTTAITTGCTSQATSTNYYVSCSTTAPAALSCRTTSSSTTTGCSVTPKTVTCGTLSPTGPPDRACNADRYSFIVYPQDGRNAGQVARIQNLLNNLAGDPNKVTSRSLSDVGTLYWRAQLSYDQSAQVEQTQDVAGVHDDCGRVCRYDPLIGRAFQDTRVSAGIEAAQLSFLSWPPGQATNPHPYNYYFDDSLGRNIPVYLVDSGATLSHPEFIALRSRARWLQVGTGSDAGESDTGGGNWHGTAMLAAIAGLRLGVAKNVEPIIVRPPGAAGSIRNQDPATFLDSLALIIADLGADSTRARVVVSMSLYYPRSGAGLWTLRGEAQESNIVARAFEAKVAVLFDALVKKGAILVTGSGNKAPFEQLPREISDGYPASLAKANNPVRIPSLIVAGAISGDAKQIAGRHDLPQGIPNVWAPGIDVPKANGNPQQSDYYVPLAGGTSYAAAHAAGLAAYFLRLTQLGVIKDRDGNFLDTAQQMRDFLVNEASWSRADVGDAYFNLPSAPRPALWNRADLGLTYCPWNPSTAVKRLRRQANAATCSVPGTTAPPSGPSDLPNLPGGISTPPGSSCIATGIATRCALGPGGQTACATTAACATWVATTTPTAPEPLQTHALRCWDAFSGHPDIKSGKVQDFASTFCNANQNTNLNSASNGIVQSYFDGNTEYKFRVFWQPSCKTTVDQQRVGEPGTAGGGSSRPCRLLASDPYFNCNNGGVGGSHQIGCLRYEFIGAGANSGSSGLVPCPSNPAVLCSAR